MPGLATLCRICQRWPLSALLAWLALWLVFVALRACGLSAALALLLTAVIGAVYGWQQTRWWRGVITLGGFLLSMLLSGLVTVAAWSWLLLLFALLLIYPLKSWRDAPLFPTPVNALGELPGYARLPVSARILDAGCGLGDGLMALRQAYPQAQLHGLELSWPLRWLSAVRCPWARVRQGDIWCADWSAYTMVYIFQRPESMGRAAAKALAECKPGSWLVSLEFEATMLVPQAVLKGSGRRALWLYQMPFVQRAPA